jgi:O-antigen/teichoic acid export membrane protein
VRTGSVEAENLGDPWGQCAEAEKYRTLGWEDSRKDRGNPAKFKWQIRLGRKEISLNSKDNIFNKFIRSYVPVKSLRERFAKGMIWVVTGSSVRQGANFVAGIILARMLGITDFGKLAVIQSTVLMLTGFGQAGIGLSSTKYIASTRSTDPQRAGRIIGFTLSFITLMAFAIVLIIILFSASIASWISPGSKISYELKISCCWIMFELVNWVQLSLLAGLESFNRSAYINLWQAIFLLPTIIVGAYFYKLSGTIIAFSVISMIGCISGHFYLKKECTSFDIKICFRNSWQERVIFKMSVMVWLSGIAMNVTNWLVGILLVRQQSGLLEFALFSAAQRLQNIVIFIPSRIYQVSVPILSNLLAIGNRSGFKKALLGASAIVLGITTVGISPIYFFSDQFMLWYGTAFLKGSAVLKIIVLSTVVSSSWTIASAGLWAAEQSKQMLMLDIIRGFLLVTLCMAGMAASAEKLALAYLTSYTIGLTLMFIVLSRYMKASSV